MNEKATGIVIPRKGASIPVYTLERPCSDDGNRVELKSSGFFLSGVYFRGLDCKGPLESAGIGWNFFG
jgi:hypothetical protein